MKKRVLSFVLTICMALAMMPAMSITATAATAINESELKTAITNANNGDTIELQEDITLTSAVTVTNAINFTLDLNGKTLNGGSYTAITLSGSGTLTIKDTVGGGRIISTIRNSNSGVIYLNGSGLVVDSGTVENTNTDWNTNAIYVSSGSVRVNGGMVKSLGDASYSIYNAGSGSVSVTGGTVQNDSVNSYAIRGNGTGSVNISGGTVMSANGFAIEQISTGDVIVSGGSIEGKRGAIYLHGYVGSGITTVGRVKISGTPTIRSNNEFYTIRLNAQSSGDIIEITGGQVENINISGTAIQVGSGTISIPSGSSIIKGGNKAMDKAPDLSHYTNVSATASINYSGTPTVAYDAGNITDYKYLKFELAPVTVPGAPTIGTATAGNGQAIVNFTAPASNGGAAITGYTVTSSPGGITRTGISSPITLTGLTNGIAYTFTVEATNSEGIGAASAESNSVTPQAPPSGGGGSGGGSSTPTIVTKVGSGENVAGANVDNLVKEKKTLTVEGKAGEKLVFDTEALKNIDGQIKESLKIEIKDVSESHKSKQPGKIVFSLTITAGGKHITSFGNGIATVSLPYELKSGEKAEDVTVWYLAEDGTMSEVPCRYDPATKLATFKTNHFSLYVVGTVDTSLWKNPFSDVKKSSWFYDAVRYVSANGLMQGTTDTIFNPGAKTTRGMIVTILWRMENEPKSQKEITFTDVKSGKYYHDAVAWAYEKGIISGYSTELFAPEDSITREQLALILYNYAASKGYKTDTATDFFTFSDFGKVHSWSKDAISWANAEGLINGTVGNLLDPVGAAQRSQVAATLQRFMENIKK